MFPHPLRADLGNGRIDFRHKSGNRNEVLFQFLKLVKITSHNNAPVVLLEGMRPAGDSNIRETSGFRQNPMVPRGSQRRGSDTNRAGSWHRPGISAQQRAAPWGRGTPPIAQLLP